MKRQEKKGGHKECLKRDRYHFKLLKHWMKRQEKKEGHQVHVGLKGTGTNSKDRKRRRDVRWV